MLIGKRVICFTISNLLLTPNATYPKIKRSSCYQMNGNNFYSILFKKISKLTNLMVFLSFDSWSFSFSVFSWNWIFNFVNGKLTVLLFWMSMHLGNVVNKYHMVQQFTLWQKPLKAKSIRIKSNQIKSKRCRQNWNEMSKDQLSSFGLCAQSQLTKCHNWRNVT